MLYPQSDGAPNSDWPIVCECLANLKENSRVYLDIGCAVSFNISDEMMRDSVLTVLIEKRSNNIRDIKGIDNPENIVLVHRTVTPDNIKEIIEENIGSQEIAFLDLDIDSYDFELLEAVLRIKKPYIIMAETNEKIPYPIEFYVKYDHKWDYSHFFGMSFASFCVLVQEDYDIVNLNANNVFAIRKDVNSGPSGLSHQEVYENGYKTPRLNGQLCRFHYNADVDHWLKLEPEEAIKQINAYFRQYQDKYYIGNNG